MATGRIGSSSEKVRAAHRAPSDRQSASTRSVRWNRGSITPRRGRAVVAEPDRSIAELPVLHGLSPRVARRVAAAAVIRRYPRRAVLFRSRRRTGVAALRAVGSSARRAPRGARIERAALRGSGRGARRDPGVRRRAVPGHRHGGGDGAVRRAHRGRGGATARRGARVRALRAASHGAPRTRGARATRRALRLQR